MISSVGSTDEEVKASEYHSSLKLIKVRNLQGLRECVEQKRARYDGAATAGFCGVYLKPGVAIQQGLLELCGRGHSEQ